MSDEDGTNVVTLHPDQANPAKAKRKRASSRIRAKSGAKTLTAEEKASKAAALRIRRYSLQQIADELGYADPSGAYKAIMRYLATEYPEAQRDKLRRDEIAIVDAIQAAAIIAATEGNLVYDSDGEPVILTDAEGNQTPLRAGPSDKAQQTVLKCVAMRARLQGLEAPTQLHVSTREGEAVQIEVSHIFAPERMAALEAVRAGLVADSMRRAGEIVDVIPTAE